MADFTAFGFDNDVEFARYLVKEVGVATVPGSSFYFEPSKGRTKVRFAFPKRIETLKRAVGLLGALKTRAVK
jgi:aspartate/methionine/tyrosine aminotransferase